VSIGALADELVMESDHPDPDTAGRRAPQAIRCDRAGTDRRRRNLFASATAGRAPFARRQLWRKAGLRGTLGEVLGTRGTRRSIHRSGRRSHTSQPVRA